MATCGLQNRIVSTVKGPIRIVTENLYSCVKIPCSKLRLMFDLHGGHLERLDGLPV